MPEIGVWTTAEGTSPARLEFESEDGGGTATEGWLDAVKGAVAGAVTGAAGGPVGALVGAATGALGAAASAGAASSATAGAAKPPADATRAKAIQALQQFAAVVPALVQILAASGKGGKETADVGDSRESAEEWDWSPESLQGTWTTP
jgi:hypothetical protein